MKQVGITATARLVDGEFTVLEGSEARTAWVGSAGHNYVGLRTRLEADGTIVIDGQSARFTRNCGFSSPSAAAAMIAGRAANGRKKWRIDGTSTTYEEWENRGVDAAVATGSATAFTLSSSGTPIAGTEEAT